MNNRFFSNGDPDSIFSRQPGETRAEHYKYLERLAAGEQKETIEEREMRSIREAKELLKKPLSW